MPGRPDEDPLFLCLRKEMEDRLADAIANLPERERLVMTLYYYEEMTMREIGLALGVVESRVSQVHASAVGHLRAALKDLGIRSPARGKEDGGGKAGGDPQSPAPVTKQLGPKVTGECHGDTGIRILK
ncbi:MAG TPA: sigma-70 family RNA polymerase sigma factor [Terracidiphilus sp.]|nr:sigma-70 family RNA polymerase sigma factor [Terracidiphilus sp.]